MRKSALFLILTGICLILVACQVAQTAQPTSAPEATVVPSNTPLPPTETPQPPTPTASAPALEIVASDGSSKSFTLDDLKALPATEGQAGIKSSTGSITPPAGFKGVSLKDLASLVGELDSSMGVNVFAKDGYGITFSYDQIMNGTFISYDPATGEELKSPDPLTAILAYEREGQPLNEEADGALRLVIVSEKNNQVTDGHWSVKWVTKIEVKALVKDWGLALNGALNTTIDRASFESCVNCHKVSWTDDKAQEWVGVPLWFLVGYVDDEIKHDGPAFNDALADAGYLVTVTASDGYAVPFSSLRVMRNDNMIVALTVNGNPLPDQYFPLRLVGTDAQKKDSIGMIADISISFSATITATAPVTPTIVPTATLPGGEADLTIEGLVNQILSLTEADLRQMEVVQITAEHPKKGQEQYEGVRLNALLDLAGVQDGAATLVFTADDGFTAEISLAEVRNCADCLVAFTETPGKLKLVMPNLPSNMWVKGVVKIEVK